MTHPDIDDRTPHPPAVSNNEGRGRRARLAVEGKPVEFHAHAVRNRAVWKHGVLLEGDQIVFIGHWCVRRLWVDDEAAEHPHHFLHRHVGVIKKSPVLMQLKLINETFAWHDGLLSNAWNTIHLNRKFEPVPVDTRGLRQVVIEEDANSISFVGLYCWARSAAVETP